MSIQNIIVSIIIAASLFFLVRRYYNIFSGKKSGCNCGTKNFVIKNGTLTEGECTCGCSHCKTATK